MRRILIIGVAVVAGLLAVLMAGAVIVANTVDINQYRPQIAQRIADALGRPISITGKLHLRAGWSPWISVEGVEVGNVPGAGHPLLLEAPRVEASVQVMPFLLSRRLSLTTLNLIDAKLWLEVDERGRGNWEGESSGGRPPLVYDAEARRVQVVFDDRRTGAHHELRIRRGNAHAEGLTGTVTLTADGRFDADRYELRGSFGPLNAVMEDGNLLRVDLDASLGGIKLGAKGTVTEPRVGRGVALALSLGGDDTELIGRWLGRPVPKLGSFRAAARLDDRTGRLALRNIDIALGQRETQLLSIKGEVADLLSDSRTRGVALDLATEGIDAGATARILGVELPAAGAFEGKARLTDADGKLALSEIGLAMGDKEKLSLVVRGRIGDLAAAGGPADMALDLTLDGRRSAALAPLVGLALPEAGTFVLSGRLGGTPRALMVENLVARLGTSDLLGEGTLALDGSRPRIALRLTSSALNLDELMPKTAPSPPMPRAGRVIPPLPFRLDWMRKLDVLVKLEARQISGLGLEAGDLKLDAGLEDGILTVRQSRTGFATGTTTVEAMVDGKAEPPRARLKLTGRNLDALRLARLLGWGDSLDGKIDVNLDLSGHGGDLRALAASLDGTVGATLANARLMHHNLDWLAADLSRMVLPGSGPEPDTQISCGVLQAELKSGLATVQTLLLDTRKVTVVGTGTANLGNESLALRLDPKPKEASLISLAHPVLVGGSFAQPSLRPDPLGVAKGVGGLALGLATGPIGFLVPFLSGGTGDSHPCAKLLPGRK